MPIHTYKCKIQNNDFFQSRDAKIWKEILRQRNLPTTVYLLSLENMSLYEYLHYKSAIATCALFADCTCILHSIFRAHTNINIVTYMGMGIDISWMCTQHVRANPGKKKTTTWQVKFRTNLSQLSPFFPYCLWRIPRSVHHPGTSRCFRYRTVAAPIACRGLARPGQWQPRRGGLYSNRPSVRAPGDVRVAWRIRSGHHCSPGLLWMSLL